MDSNEKDANVHRTQRILIVDDEPEVLQMTAFVLERQGFEVVIAENGVKALEAIRQRQPDLILTDVIMPEMDGYTFYKELKKDALTADIPVLIITARGKMEDTFKVVGVDGFIAKPILPEELFAEIDHVLTIAETRREISAGGREHLNKRILVASGNETALANMKFQAERAGYVVATAHSSAEAIAKVVKFLPDIIFIDALLEDLTAGELVHVFCRLPQLENKPIIGFCFYDTQQLGDTQLRKKILTVNESRKQMMQCGATQYMGRYNHQLFIRTLQENLRPPKA